MTTRTLGAIRAELRDAIDDLSVFGMLHQSASVSREEAARATCPDAKHAWNCRAAWLQRLAERCFDADLCPHAAENLTGDA
jgi:hypothetical protein